MHIRRVTAFAVSLVFHLLLVVSIAWFSSRAFRGPVPGDLASRRPAIVVLPPESSASETRARPEPNAAETTRGDPIIGRYQGPSELRIPNFTFDFGKVNVVRPGVTRPRVWVYSDRIPPESRRLVVKSRARP